VNAPRSWPNSSEAISVPGSAAQLTVISARSARRERRWMARATSSLPVPVSPVMSTVESVAATFSRWLIIRRSGFDEPTISSNIERSSSSWRSASFSSWRRLLSRAISSNARALATAAATGCAMTSRISTSCGANPCGSVRMNTMEPTRRSWTNSGMRTYERMPLSRRRLSSENLPPRLRSSQA